MRAVVPKVNCNVSPSRTKRRGSDRPVSLADVGALPWLVRTTVPSGALFHVRSLSGEKPRDSTTRPFPPVPGKRASKRAGPAANDVDLAGFGPSGCAGSPPSTRAT